MICYATGQQWKCWKATSVQATSVQVGFQSQLRLFFALILANTVAGLSSHWIHFEFLVTFQTITLNFFTLHFLSQTLFSSNSTSFSHSDRWKPWQSHHQGPMPHGCKRNGKCFISAFPQLADPKKGPWLAWWGRGSVVALALSWDIGQQGYATHLVGWNGS